MSYIVLARKWRPMTFEQVVGQKHVIVTLQNAIKNGRLANAYLFAGPRGVGKTTVARILAKAINCQKGPTITPCNECSNCREINDSRSLDVFEIDGASNRGIDEVRNLRENIKYAPIQGKYKIYIIDEVHMLTDPAFNALLKTLEEPPSRVMFIFATTEPHKIIATILSRCQRFDFKRIVVNEIIKQLKQICNAEKIKIDEEALHLIAKKADGSMRDGQSLLDQSISFCGEKISGKEVSELLGIIDQEIYFQISDIIKNKDQKKGLLLIDEIFLNGFDLNELLTGLNEHFRNILIVKSTNSTDQLDVAEAYASRYLEIADNFQEEGLLRLIKIVSDTEYIIKKSSNPRLTLELSMIKMIKIDNTKKIEDLLIGLDDLKSKIVSTQQNQNSNYNPNNKNTKLEKKNIVKDQNERSEKGSELEDSSIESKTVTIEEIKSIWTSIIEDVKKEKIALGSFLNEGVPSKIEGNTLIISFGKENGFHIKSINNNHKVIENVLLKFLGVKLRIKCVKDKNVNVKQNRVINYDSYLESLAQKVPHFKTIIEVFDGELAD